MKIIFITSWLIFSLFCFNTSPASAETLTQRLSSYPNWHHKPTLEKHKGDLVYPEWFEGTWQVTSVLTEQIAPLAPNIVTPGFESNRRYIQQPITFQVRFQSQPIPTSGSWPLPPISALKSSIGADRQYNGLAIARAYLGEKGVLAVKSDRKNPTCLITTLPQQRKLISTVIGYSQVSPTDHQFITTELTQQQFKINSDLFLNEVETTTEYRLIHPRQIEADQITAIYLSPQDPNYFQSLNQPVAIYRYRLLLTYAN